MSVDMIGDFLTIIRNGVMASKSSVEAPCSRERERIAEILKEEGFIRNVTVKQVEGKAFKRLKVDLKYVGGESVIHEIKRISKPGRRVYEGTKQLSHVIGGLGIAIVTTNQGIMTNKEAKRRAVGGEVICSVW
jgi:small subunit ribosomal protein S8